jgi:hypothetical protein
MDSGIRERTTATVGAFPSHAAWHRGHVVAVTHKVVFGSTEALQSGLAVSAASTTINTSFVERDNLTLRQQNRRLTRKMLGFSKELSWLERQLWVALAYYHLVLPHASLRMALAEPQPTRGTGSTRRWRPITPAMAAGVTNHVWTTTDLLSYRVPATFLDRLGDLERLFPSFDDAHHGY